MRACPECGGREVVVEIERDPWVGRTMLRCRECGLAFDSVVVEDEVALVSDEVWDRVEGMPVIAGDDGRWGAAMPLGEGSE